MSLQSDNCNDITNSLLCTPIIWNHSEKNWNGISLRVVSEKLNRDNVVLNQANGGGRTFHAMFAHHHLPRVMLLRYSAYVCPVQSVPLFCPKPVRTSGHGCDQPSQQTGLGV